MSHDHGRISDVGSPTRSTHATRTRDDQQQLKQAASQFVYQQLQSTPPTGSQFISNQLQQATSFYPMYQYEAEANQSGPRTNQNQIIQQQQLRAMSRYIPQGHQMNRSKVIQQQQQHHAMGPSIGQGILRPDQQQQRQHLLGPSIDQGILRPDQQQQQQQQQRQRQHLLGPSIDQGILRPDELLWSEQNSGRVFEQEFGMTSNIASYNHPYNGNDFDLAISPPRHSIQLQDEQQGWVDDNSQTETGKVLSNAGMLDQRFENTIDLCEESSTSSVETVTNVMTNRMTKPEPEPMCPLSTISNGMTNAMMKQEPTDHSYLTNGPTIKLEQGPPVDQGILRSDDNNLESVKDTTNAKKLELEQAKDATNATNSQVDGGVGQVAKFLQQTTTVLSTVEMEVLYEALHAYELGVFKKTTIARVVKAMFGEKDRVWYKSFEQILVMISTRTPDDMTIPEPSFQHSLLPTTALPKTATLKPDPMMSVTTIADDMTSTTATPNPPDDGTLSDMSKSTTKKRRGEGEETILSPAAEELRRYRARGGQKLKDQERAKGREYDNQPHRKKARRGPDQTNAARQKRWRENHEEEAKQKMKGYDQARAVDPDRLQRVQEQKQIQTVVPKPESIVIDGSNTDPSQAMLAMADSHGKMFDRHEDKMLKALTHHGDSMMKALIQFATHQGDNLVNTFTSHGDNPNSKALTHHGDSMMKALSQFATHQGDNLVNTFTSYGDKLFEHANNERKDLLNTLTSPSKTSPPPPPPQYGNHRKALNDFNGGEAATKRTLAKIDGAIRERCSSLQPPTEPTEEGSA